MQFSLSLVIGIIFLLLIIATGYRLYKTGRYHIFYFALCGVFLLSLLLMFLSIGASIESMPDDTNGIAATPVFESLSFYQTITTGMYVMLSILSLINPFIRKNKLSVKIVSGIMILLCGYLGVMAYALAHFAG